MQVVLQYYGGSQSHHDWLHTKSCSNDLEDLGYANVWKHPIYIYISSNWSIWGYLEGLGIVLRCFFPCFSTMSWFDSSIHRPFVALGSSAPHHHWWRQLSVGTDNLGLDIDSRSVESQRLIYQWDTADGGEILHRKDSWNPLNGVDYLSMMLEFHMFEPSISIWVLQKL